MKMRMDRLGRGEGEGIIYDHLDEPRCTENRGRRTTTSTRTIGAGKFGLSNRGDSWTQ